jgi:thiosulfate/3-mercaptopyruvate sulfurtransferase
MTCGLSATPASANPKMFVESDWLAAHSADPGVLILHVGRDRATYDSGHIPNAHFLPFAEIATTREGVPNQLPSAQQLKAAFEKVGVGDKTQVVLYSDRIGLYAARAYFALDYLGHGSRAALLNGGLEKWKLESRPVSQEEPRPTPALLTVHPHPRLVLDRRQVQRMLKDRRVVLVDARPPDEYSGTKLTDGAPRAGHIPGARNVFWVDNLESTQNPVLKPMSEIQKRYEQAGVRRGKRVVVYCRAGVQAAHDYVTLKMLGYRPLIYDGSFFEWSNAKDTPVEMSGSPEKQP